MSMTVGDLRKALDGFRDDQAVLIYATDMGNSYGMLGLQFVRAVPPWHEAKDDKSNWN